MSMNPTQTTDTLFYPFHLCHEETLRRLLARFHRVHFRDYMAIQLSPFSGTTAFADRMGGTFPDLVAAGRIVQGHHVSGPLTGTGRASVDRDLADQQWRRLFHEALRENRRFQRGLFDPAHAMTVGRDVVPGPAALLRLMREDFLHEPFTMEAIQQLSRQGLTGNDAYRFEYGLALVKTAAAQHYTIQLAHRLRIAPATDSSAHFQLFGRALEREQERLPNHLVIRTGY
ncbi:MAG: hypothetical protein IT389_14965 [Nitrospira sp.]|nr:hypothetical protein [Nitrospira sp.]